MGARRVAGRDFASSTTRALLSWLFRHLVQKHFFRESGVVNRPVYRRTRPAKLDPASRFGAPVSPRARVPSRQLELWKPGGDAMASVRSTHQRGRWWWSGALGSSALRRQRR
ncbi:hypothetical protein GY45DRAFT_1328280 [Cubamyces sp. BRFM 1775]|nr:hypothetical protein GY45DRAFT_1328280 [Cubamyces sp. BRFM 1775]